MLNLRYEAPKTHREEPLVNVRNLESWVKRRSVGKVTNRKIGLNQWERYGVVIEYGQEVGGAE